MSNAPEDKDLDDYLKGNSELSKLYQSTADQEPPAHLDQIILREAHAAVANKATTANKEKRKGFFQRLFASDEGWLMPTASVATIAMVAVIVAVLVTNPETDKESNTPIATQTDSNKKPITDSRHDSGTQPVSNNTPGKTDSKAPTSPEAWLKSIKTMHTKGKTDQAKTSLALFYKQYPNYPKDKLKKLLQGTNLVQ